MDNTHNKIGKISIDHYKEIDKIENRNEDNNFYDIRLNNTEENGEDHKQFSDHNFPKYKKKYIPGRGIDKYNKTLKNLVPIRSNEQKEKGMTPIDNAGLFSTISFSWISKFMYKAYRKGLKTEDLPNLSIYDTSDYNSDRLEILWKEELSKMGADKASFTKVTWRFCRTRIYASSFIFILSLVFGFISPTILMRKLLEYVQSENDYNYIEGIKWALFLTLAELLRAIFFAWTWGINYTTALRLRSACLTLIYKKIIKVNNLGDTSIGEVINMFSNDAQRIYDMILFGPMIIGGPIITVWGIIYILLLLGPMALLGMITFLLFYPIQYVISRLTGYLRTESVKISDIRVRLMNEILECMKLIKMYAWEKRFSHDLLDIRNQEQELLVKTSYCQSFSVSMAPTIPVISSIITFLAHVSSGNNLTASQAFPLSTFFGNQIKQALIRLREGSQAIIDSIVAFRRFKVFPYVSFINSRFRSSMSSFEYGIESIIAAGISYNRVKLCIAILYLSIMYFIFSGDPNSAKKLLLLEEGNCYISKPIFKSQAVAISKGTFACNTFSNQRNGNNFQLGITDIGKRKNDHRLNKGDDTEEEKLNRPTITADHLILFEISFEAAKGKLIGICGHVGSGKSSLLLAALGQLRVSKGQVMRDGSCAYVSQQAWITNATLRENILFGESFDHSRYHKAIYACNLIEDIGMMPGGDKTEIGEKGVNLSGGQKQRVALARALYADRDIYFLDDPLSAVDSCVGSYIFDNLILGALRGKTVLFVTHQIQYLNHCDDIYMMQNGRIIEHGTHDELMKLGNEYASMVAAISTDNESKDDTIFLDRIIETAVQSADDIPIHAKELNETPKVKRNSLISSQISIEKCEVQATPLTVADHVHQGTIKPMTYKSYISAGGGYFFFFLVILMFLTTVASTTFSSWWLALWIKAGSGNTTIVYNNRTIISKNINDNPDFSYYQTIYISSIGAILLSSLLRSLVFTKATIGASTELHNNLFEKIISSPMRFFETTPSGRIQHLFSRDMDEVDNRLPITLTSFIQNVFIIFFSVLVICLVFPWFILPLSLLAVFYYFVSKVFKVAVTDLKRMENKSRAPIISYVTATVQGLSTIHAFEKENDFMTKFTDMFDENSKYLFLCNIAMRWLAVRIDSLSVIIIAITAFLVIGLKDYVPAALAGLALSYSSQISGVFQYTVRLVSETEVRFISVEKINHYIRTLRSEGNDNRTRIVPSITWPAAAEIKFNDVSMAYGDGAPLILKNVSFKIEAGEKIGIVGRTGSGKSSLTVALFRLVELVEGKIEIDDVDISEISLSQLRTKLSIIPQDPVLFSGTIRSNLDPFKVYTDAEIWEALEKTNLKNRVQLISGNLDASVGFGGDNLSVGERQLLCLSRALLRNSKILVLDEATAAVDPETEIAVQSTIQREFSHCTILTIAHRLQTVLSLNRILVMENGRVLEFDTPANLIGNESSEFYKMITAAEKTIRQ